MLSIIDWTIKEGINGAFWSAKKCIIFYKSAKGLSKTNADIL